MRRKIRTVSGIFILVMVFFYGIGSLPTLNMRLYAVACIIFTAVIAEYGFRFFRRTGPVARFYRNCRQRFQAWRQRR